MKGRLISLTIAVFIFIFVATHFTSRESQIAAPLPRQTPEPTPLNQHWKVEYGEIESLEERLHTLNAAGMAITDSEIRISMDGKRFVIATADAEESDEDGK